MTRKPTDMELRVAGALVDAWHPDMDWDDTIEAAKAAIRAMRVPTWEMLTTHRVPCAVGDCPGYGLSKVMYEKMIDAASPEDEDK